MTDCVDKKVDYVKRIQSNLSGKKIKLSRPAIKDELELLGYTNETLNDELAVLVINKLVDKFSEEIKLLPECEPVDNTLTSQEPQTEIQDSTQAQESSIGQETIPSIVQELVPSTQTISNASILQTESKQETETGIIVSDGEKHDLITTQASCLGIELSEVEVVDLATNLKDDFLDYETFIDEVVTAVVTYHDHRTDKLEQKIRDAREHIEFRRKGLNQTLVGEFGEMNNFFRQGAAKRRELSKVIAAAFKT